MDPKKELLEELKKKGLNIAEDMIKDVVEAVLDSIPAFAAKSDNKVDDFLATLIPMAKPHIMALVDKIDGEQG